MKIFQKIVVQLAGFFPEYHMSTEDFSLVSCQEVPPTSWVDGALKAAGSPTEGSCSLQPLSEQRCWW